MSIEDLKVVLKVAELHSITKAANALNMHTATASAAVKRVELDFGIEFFIRSTRNLRLSSAGERYLPECEQAIAQLEQIKCNIKASKGIIEGDIHISLPSDLGRNQVLNWLNELTEQHPHLSLKVHIRNEVMNFYRNTVDMALYYGEPNDSGMYGFQICEVPLVLCASPEYLTKHGRPNDINDLLCLKNAHIGLFYQHYDTLENEWLLFKDQQKGKKVKYKQKVKLSGSRITNDGDIIHQWCLQGHGIAQKSCLDVADDLLSGRLVSILPDWKPKPSELWLICPSKQTITPTVRLVREMFSIKCETIINDLQQNLVI